MMFRRTQSSTVMRWALSLALLAGFGYSLRAEDAAPKLEELFPDTTIAAIAFPDLDSARKLAGSTRIGELLKQPEMREFLDPIVARMKAQYAESRTANPMLPSLEDLDGSIFSSELAVCVYSHGPGLDPGVVFSIKPKDAKAFDTMLNTLFKAVSHGQQDLPKDVPFPLGEGENVPGMLYSKGRLLVVKPMADMIAVAERIADPAKRAKGSLASSPAFAEARAGMKAPAAWFYANPAALIEIAEEQAAAQGGEQVAKVKAVLNVLAIDKLNSMLLGLTFDGGEPGIESYVGTGEDATKGIFSLMGAKGPPKDLLQIAAVDAPYVAGASMNIAAIFPLIRSVLTVIDPNANKQLDDGMAMVNGMIKFDIEKDFLQNIDGQFVTAQTAFDTSLPLSFNPGMVSLAHVKDPAKIEDCFAKLKAFADAMKFSEKVPAFYIRYDMTTYKGTKIYYISQTLGSSGAFAVVKDHLLMGTSVNATKRGIDQMSASSNITSNKDFQATLARVTGKAFDADKLPISFGYSTDMGGGGGVLFMTGLSITAQTAALAVLSEAVNKGKEPAPAPMGGPDMFGLGELKSKPAGRTAIDIANSIDLNRWPDEEFFAKRRQSHGSFSAKTAKGWSSHSEFPPPLPHYGSAALMPMVVAVVAAIAIPNMMRARNMAQNAALMQNQVPPPLVAQNPKQAAGNAMMNNLRQIHLAITLFETDHNALPTKAADLFPQYISDATIFKDPANPKKEAAYVLVTGVLSKDADALLAYENPADDKAKNGRNVLKTDGSVEHLSDDDFKQLLKDTKEIVSKAGRKFGTLPLTSKDLNTKK